MEGRFHHDGQVALYVSPSPDWAFKAIEAYLKPDDPPRVVVPMEIACARVVDLRDAHMCSALGIEPADAGVPWLPERAINLPASTWRPSDRSRQFGADGMIYTARAMPSRWHLVLFKWNEPGGPCIRVTGAPVPLTLR
jgi:RES domain-containing protein